MHLKYSMSFPDLIDHFFLMLNNITLSGCTTVYLSIHLLKDNMVVSSLAIMNKAAINICVWGFPGDTVVKNPPDNAGDTGSSPGLGRSHMPWSN